MSKNITDLMLEFLGVMIVLDCILNTRWRIYMITKRNDETNPIIQIFFDILGNIYLIKFIILIFYSSFRIRDYSVQGTRSDIEFSNTIFVKGTLFSVGIIFFQIVFLFPYTYMKKKYIQKNGCKHISFLDVFWVLISVIISFGWFVLIYKYEINENEINEIYDGGIVFIISLLLIAVIVFFIFSIKKIRELKIFSLMETIFNLFYYWQQDTYTVDWNCVESTKSTQSILNPNQSNLNPNQQNPNNYFNIPSLPSFSNLFNYGT